jgi:hypothetical protein
MNNVTPRLFVAATEQNDGKTTTCLGLFAALSKRLGRIGYIKPVGQRFVTIDGMNIDEDTVLIEQTYKVRTPLEAMSPIAVEPDFTRKYIEEAHHEALMLVEGNLAFGRFNIRNLITRSTDVGDGGHGRSDTSCNRLTTGSDFATKVRSELRNQREFGKKRCERVLCDELEINAINPICAKVICHVLLVI